MLPNPTTTRRISVVMFADIEGYTRRFQQDEADALRLADRHRADIHELTQSHHGQVVQFFGDGSLTVFANVQDALQCAVALQSASRVHDIPLRIGLHVGELVYREDDIFGDAVNVAARIQATGIAGSILVSGKIASELHNHPDIRLRRLGAYALKNISEPLEIYAVEGEGLSIPLPHKEPRKRSAQWRTIALYMGILIVPAAIWWWKAHPFANESWRSERIAVPPFINLTGDPAMQMLGLQAADLISNQIESSSKGRSLDLRQASIITSGQLDQLRRDPRMALAAGCRYMLEGAYGYTSATRDSLYFLTEIIDCKTRKPLNVKLRRVVCPAAFPQQGIDQLISVIRGYWETRHDGLLSVPTWDAQRAYLKAIQQWGGPREDEAKPYLLEAIRLDTSYLDPYLLLLTLFYNTGQSQNAIDTLKLIRTRFPQLTGRQAQHLAFYEADISGNRQQAWKMYQPILKEDPTNLLTNTSGMVMALEFINQPERALELFRMIPHDSLNLVLCDYCRTRYVLAVSAFTQLGMPDSALYLAEQVRSLVRRNDEYLPLFPVYLPHGDTVSIRTLLNRIEQDSVRARSLPYLMYEVSQTAKLLGLQEVHDHFAREVIRRWRDQDQLARRFTSGEPLTSRERILVRTIARCMASLEQTDAAIQWYERMLTSGHTTLGRLGELGMLYAKSGNTSGALEIARRIQTDYTTQFDYGEANYQIASIHVYLGDHPEAVRWLSRSLAEGILYAPAMTFQFDPNMLPLARDPDYIALLSVRQTQ